MTAAARARALIVLGGALIAAAAYLLGGWPAALLVAGAELVAYGLLFVDEDAEKARPDGGADGERPA